MTQPERKDSTPVPSSQVAILPMDRVSWIAIGRDVEGQRLDNYLIRVAKGVPKSHVYRVIRSGEVRINKARAKAESRLQLGDIVRVPPMRVAERKVDAAPAVALREGAVPVLYEDNHIMIVNKPAGIAAHGGSGIAHGLIERMRASRHRLAFLELAHRLDRETSGAIILCKTRKALVRLHDMMKAHEVEKHYRALVMGDWVNDRQHVKLPLTRYLLPNGERRVRVDRAEGMHAHTIFNLLARFGRVSYLDVHLQTGRTHQIRVHALSQGHPLVGDDKYGDFEWNRKVAQGLLGVPFKRMFLHAYSLRFTHPVTKELVSVRAPLWPECVEVLQALKNKQK